MDGPAAEAVPDAVDDGGLVVAFDDRDGAAGAATPAHLVELVGGWAVQELWVWCAIRFTAYSTIPVASMWSASADR